MTGVSSTMLETARAGALNAGVRPETLRSMSIHASGIRVRSWLLLAMATLLGCSQSETVTTEVVPLARGEFHGISWGGTQKERFYVLAHGGSPKDPSGTMLLVSPDNKEPCELGTDAARYLRPLQPGTAGKYVVGSPSPARIMLVDDLDENRVGTLQFADIHCQRQGPMVPDAQYIWYLFEPDLTKLTLAVLRSDSTLLLIDPWSEEQHEVTHDVSGFDSFDSGMTLIESGKLTQRDRKGELRLRRGSAVVNFWQLSGGGDVAYQDANGLYVRRDGTDKKLADAGCNVRTLDAFMPGALAYSAPCEQDKPSRLKVTADDKTYTYAENVDDVHQDAGLLLYTTTREDKTQLWLVQSSSPEEPSLIAEQASFQLTNVASLRAGKLFLKARQQDGSFTVWQLDKSDSTHTLVELAKGLADITVTQNGLAVLTGSDELWITDPTLTQIVKKVPNARNSRYGFVFNGKSSAVVYLDGVDADTGQGSLELQFLNGQHISLDRDVREWTQVWWPERGIVYARGGDEPGIHFARVDIPCESASETAWACGF